MFNAAVWKDAFGFFIEMLPLISHFSLRILKRIIESNIRLVDTGYTAILLFLWTTPLHTSSYV